MILEKNLWTKSCFFLWDLQNELWHVWIGQLIKKFVFFGTYFPVRIILRQGKLTKEGPWEGEILRLEKNVWSKSCLKYLDLQNELPYVEIGPQIKK